MLSENLIVRWHKVNQIADQNDVDEATVLRKPYQRDQHGAAAHEYPTTAKDHYRMKPLTLQHSICY